MATRRAYDLMVLIDAEATDESRAAIIEELRKQISVGDGELKGDADWGRRKLAYEIDHRVEAHYHLFQLEAEPALLTQLDRNLRINDTVVRHRIIRLLKGVPEETPRPAAQRYSDEQVERSSSDRRSRTEQGRQASTESAAPEQPSPPPADSGAASAGQPAPEPPAPEQPEQPAQPEQQPA